VFTHLFLVSWHWTSMIHNISNFAAFVFCSVSVVHNEAKEKRVKTKTKGEFKVHQKSNKTQQHPD